MTNKEAKEYLEELLTIDDSIYLYNPVYLEAFNKAIKALEELPKRRKAVKRWKRKAIEAQNISSAEPEPKWIPVSEYGYPNPEDEYKHFLTVDNKGEITIQEFLLSLDEEPQPYFTGMRNIVAYMPLPESYKGE